VLEAVHRASGLPMVADYYTRLYPVADVTVQDGPLFDALNRVGDAMRLRWAKDGDWLQCRSACFFHDRQKEVPNRFLERWATARREHGMLTLDELIEISQLPGTQQEGRDMAEGAKEVWGLAEWDLARNYMVRPHLQYLASFTSEQRQELLSVSGLPITRMSLAQQQQFITFACGAGSEGIQSWEELAGATLRVDYSQPGEFEWRPPGPGWFRWMVPAEPGKRAMWAPVRERTREAALQAARAIDARILQSLLAVARKSDPRIQEEQFMPQEVHIVPTELSLVFLYSTGILHERPVRAVRPFSTDGFLTTGPE
jgi:hypothetical protein